MTREAFLAWLNGVVCTSPFTPGDASELKALIHCALGPDVYVDVYTTKGDKVHVRVDGIGALIEKALDVV